MWAAAHGRQELSESLGEGMTWVSECHDIEEPKVRTIARCVLGAVSKIARGLTPFCC